MPDREELDLSVLSRTPVGALPGAAAARSRGDRRTRRTRAALAGAGALVAVLAVTAGTALSGGGTERVAPFADPSPPVVEEEGLAVSLLDPEDLPGSGRGAWEVRATDDLPFDPLPAGCEDPARVFGSPAATALRFLDGDGRVVGHGLKGYADEAQAQAAYGRMIDAIEACGESTPGYQLWGGVPGTSASRSYGTYGSGSQAVVFAVERIGALVSGVALRPGALEEGPALADAAAAEAEGGPFDAPEVEPAPPPPPLGPEAALLDPDAASSVEPGPWAVSSTEVDRFFDPCHGSPPLSAAEQSASRLLAVDRPSGGTRVAHEVLLYDSADGAAAALRELREAVDRCAPTPSDGGDGTTTYEVVEEQDDELLVAVTEQCPACSTDSPHAVRVTRVGRGLSVLRIVVVEQGGPGRGLVDGYGGLARERLEALVGPS